ncbi:MAG: TRAM domain-containing protein [Ornithinimicrobium sp.]|uniref:class I SAM-dependent RNA methyltransferase n=1 Tax=Ornithinimicrobium sp. TaxID=1977084 RepID=UPI0026E0E7C0|nr:TRAM domain-containing protein [Ornithinimicrobium sp.]MDO5738739.1 TRAM domain-containing protein [Ornithinimicrobium sp.]
MSEQRGAGLAVGDVVIVDVGAVAHGGHCVARDEGGQVLFVRHTLPGEQVRASVTEIGSGGRFVRADAIEVLRAAPGRVTAPCPFSGPGRCGGCDWQHVSLPEQRRLKAAVVVEQFERLAGISADALVGPDGVVSAGGIVCEPLAGDDEGLRWRTRVGVSVSDGRTGLRVHRSHAIQPVDDCLIADQGVVGTGVFQAHPDDPVVALDVVVPSVGGPVVVALGEPTHRPRKGRHGRPQSRAPRHTPQPLAPVPTVTERVGAHDFTLSARSFWQVHPGAATTFTDQVLQWLDPRPGESALDLYAGVGLFAVPLAERVGRSGRVLAVEADRVAADAAERHLLPWSTASVWADSTERALADLVADDEHADVVVLDPPRTGAGRQVVESIAALRPRAVVYVACDPAALARDVAVAREVGLELARLRVFDAFPMTHHMECLALLLPAAPSSPELR